MSGPGFAGGEREPPPLTPEEAEADAAGFAAARARDAALILPAFGALLFLPPLVGVFATDARILGVPLIVVWLFAAWGLLIFLAWRLARRLGRIMAEGEGGGG